MWIRGTLPEANNLVYVPLKRALCVLSSSFRIPHHLTYQKSLKLTSRTAYLDQSRIVHIRSKAVLVRLLIYETCISSPLYIQSLDHDFQDYRRAMYYT